MEYIVLLKFYSKLVDVLQVKSLAPYLVGERIISTQDRESIDLICSKKRAAELLLAKVSAPLKAGFDGCTVSFYKLLNIAKQHGNIDTVQLCDEIEECLTIIKSPDQERNG